MVLLLGGSCIEHHLLTLQKVVLAQGLPLHLPVVVASKLGSLALASLFDPIGCSCAVRGIIGLVRGKPHVLSDGLKRLIDLLVAQGGELLLIARGSRKSRSSR